ncbi:MAG: MarR family transcriptional regulator [Bdellovibrio sp.]|nr:MarR family transcriptional regulator [Bdellovibrio sp.]
MYPYYMEILDPLDCPYYLVSRATLAITSALKMQFAEAGFDEVKPAYLGTLLVLWRDGDLKVVDLGRRAGLEPSTMTGLLDRMEQSALISRHPDPDDRRAQIIQLTSTGQKMRPKIMKILQKTLDQILGDVSAMELETSKRVMRRILSNAQRGETK